MQMTYLFYTTDHTEMNKRFNSLYPIKSCSSYSTNTTRWSLGLMHKGMF